MDEALAALRLRLSLGRCLIGFDFDGTLVPLQRDPNAVALPNDARALLARLAKRYECALVSGRGIDDLAEHAPIAGFHFIGNHGAQIRKSDGSQVTWESKEWADWQRANPRPFEDLFSVHGGRIENKGLSLAVHFRLARDEGWWEQAGPLLSERMRGIAEIMPGVMCWNVIPRGAPHKGTATVRLCRELGLEAIAFFGDEVTDENVFGARELPVVGIKVGSAPSLARYRVAHPGEVLTLIERLLS